MCKILFAVLAVMVSMVQVVSATALVDFTAVQTSFTAEYPAVITVGVAVLAIIITVGLLVRLLRRLVGR